MLHFFASREDSRRWRDCRRHRGRGRSDLFGCGRQTALRPL